MAKNVGANLGLLLMASLVGLFLCEVSLRTFYPKYRHLADTQFYADKRRLWANPPDTRSWFPHPNTGVSHAFHHNNLGLRQHRNFSAADLASATNVAIFGDSFVANRGMPAPYSFTEPLDYLLNQGGKPFNVLNFGTEGYGPGQSFLHYETFHFRRNIDYVVFVYCENDIGDLAKRRLFALDDTGRLVERRPRRRAWLRRLTSGLHLSYLILDGNGRLYERIENRVIGNKQNRYDRDRSFGKRTWTNRYRKAVFRQLLRRWKHRVEHNGGVFRVMTLPNAPIPPSLADVFSEAEVEVIDLYACFNRRDNHFQHTSWNQSPYRFKKDSHWNEAGNRLAAICLYRTLEEEMRLPTRTAEDLRAALDRYYAAFGGWMPRNAGGANEVHLPAAMAGIRGKYEAFGGLAPIREALRKAQAGKLVIDSDFDVYLNRKRLTYIKEGCRPTDLDGHFFLNWIPVTKNDLPEHRVQYGWERGQARFRYYRIDRDRCVVEKSLPHYPVRSLWTGQYDRDAGVRWEGEFAFGLETGGTRSRQFVPVAGQRIIASDFDVYLDGKHLVYIKKECRPSDREAAFFLHATPLEDRDLPPDRVRYGFDNLDFNACTIEWRRPSYAIGHIRTGQFVKDDQGNTLPLWEDEYTIGPGDHHNGKDMPAAGTRIIASDFDCYLDDARIICTKEECRPSDREAVFFLHVTPLEDRDLPPNRVHYGFDNLDRNSLEWGFRIDEFGCTIKRQLPAYAIRHIRTGQFVEDAQGNYVNLWEGEFFVDRGVGVEEGGE